MSGQFVELQFSFRLDLEPILILLTSNNVQSWVALEDWALCVECSLANDKWGSRSAPPPRPAQWMNDRNLSGGLWCTVRQPKDFHIFFILSHHLTHKTHFTLSHNHSHKSHTFHTVSQPHLPRRTSQSTSLSPPYTITFSNVTYTFATPL